MAKSTFLNSNIDLQNTRNLSLSNRIIVYLKKASLSETYSVTYGGKHLCFLFLERGL